MNQAQDKSALRHRSACGGLALLILSCVVVSVPRCAPGAAEQKRSAMKITSSAFQDGGRIPTRYTCDGGDLIPPLRFEEVPAEAVSLALIVDDPDAPGGTWDHWVVWNIPPSVAGIAEGETPEGIVGRNSWKENGWGGPCPPSGEHRYVFRLYALDASLDLPSSAGKSQLERAMKSHLLDQCELVCRYRRTGR